MPTSKTDRNSPFFLWPSLVAIVAIAFWAAAAAMAQPISSADARQRAELQRLAQQRDDLARRLNAADLMAAEALKNGDDTIVIHAEQAGLQDQLDLVELRLEMMSARAGVPVPEPRRVDPDDPYAGDDKLRQRTDAAFQRGRARALRQVTATARVLLSSIDFADFHASRSSKE